MARACPLAASVPAAELDATVSHGQLTLGGSGTVELLVGVDVNASVTINTNPITNAGATAVHGAETVVAEAAPVVTHTVDTVVAQAAPVVTQTVATVVAQAAPVVNTVEHAASSVGNSIKHAFHF